MSHSANRHRLVLRVEAFEAGIARIGFAICNPLKCAIKNCTKKITVKGIDFCRLK